MLRRRLRLHVARRHRHWRPGGVKFALRIRRAGPSGSAETPATPLDLQAQPARRAPPGGRWAAMSAEHPNPLIPQLQKLAKAMLRIPGGCDECDAYQSL